MATLYKHGPLKGIYRPKGQFVNPGMRMALFENGTVLRRRRRGGPWEMTHFNSERLLAGGSLVVEDLSPEARAICTRVTAASHAHEGAKKLRRIERSLREVWSC